MPRSYQYPLVDRALVIGMCYEAPYREGEEGELLLYAVMSRKKKHVKKLISNMTLNCIFDKKATEKRNKLSL